MVKNEKRLQQLMSYIVSFSKKDLKVAMFKNPDKYLKYIECSCELRVRSVMDKFINCEELNEQDYYIIDRFVEIDNVYLDNLQKNKGEVSSNIEKLRLLYSSGTYLKEDYDIIDMIYQSHDKTTCKSYK